MRVVSAGKITAVVSDLCIRANTCLRQDVLRSLKIAYAKEKGARAKKILSAIIKNSGIARKEKLAICQDTGLAVVFVQIGRNVKIPGDLRAAINKGVALGYRKGVLRNSVVKDPLLRGGPGYAPCVMHAGIIGGNKVRITVLPKGFGCENKSQLKMFNPTAGLGEIKKFIIETVKSAGPDACPPFVVGVGIGGTADYALYLAKKALLRKVTRSPGHRVTGNVPKLESELLKAINKLNIGPMGLGGRATCLGVNIETYPTHIAGLPVAVNISCHALRSASKAI